METELADRLDLAWELRLMSYTYREAFGHPPSGIWRASGTVTLLADEHVRLTVAARWGAIVAAGSRADGVVESMRMSRPDQRVRLTVEEAAAGAGPSWARTGLRSARAGATLLINADLPEGSGVGSAAAAQTAIGLALHELAAPLQTAGGKDPDRAGAGSGSSEAGTALLGDRRLPFDLNAAGLRLMVIDTQVRGTAQPEIVEHAPMEAAAKAVDAGAFEALGAMLTAAHAALASDDVQDIAVSAALDAGALGARMIVDGPGRPVCVLLPADRLADVRIGVLGAFAARQLRAPRFLSFSPA